MIEIKVDIENNPYRIIIGEKAIEQNALMIAEKCLNSKVMIISDNTVWDIHGEYLKSALENNGLSTKTVCVDEGEESKSIEMLTRLYSEFFNFGLTRNDPVIAFGGGVVGDLAGFAAATYMRGVPLIQVPTTLLAQVDSSVGGKVAVNIKEGKNLAGCFYQPSLVISDTSVLDTLPEREIKAGMAEIIKYALIGQNELFELLRYGNISKSNIEQIIYLSCDFKKNLSQIDEHDNGIRRILNFGHSFAHAIEKYHDYETFKHGEAVSIGMNYAITVSERLNFLTSENAKMYRSMIKDYGLITECDAKISDWIHLMKSDKKNQGNGLSLVLINDENKPFIKKITCEDLLSIFE